MRVTDERLHDHKLMRDEDSPMGWRAGAIAVTGGGGHVGTGLRRRLSSLSNRTLAVSPGEPLGGARVLVHLAGTVAPQKPNTIRTANLETVARTLERARGTGLERIVFLSFAGADPGARNEYLRAKGRAEELLRASGIATTIFRCTNIFGPPESPGPTIAGYRPRRPGRSALVFGDGDRPITPLYREDVVEAVVHAALDPAAPAGTFSLAGRDTVRMDEFVARVNAPGTPIRHVPRPLGHVLGLMVPELNPALVDLLRTGGLPDGDPGTTAAAFGIALHGFRDVWR